ncbi:MAG: hypothetical protein MMC23_003403 [Stictis urceolatum]|nr:hypothetical protein [Stictis urceolata]
MHSLILTLVGSLPVALAASSKSFSVEVYHEKGAKHTLPAVSGTRLGVSTSSKVVETNDQGFWFANFTIGAAKEQSILIDTGSSDAIMNPGLYKPSAGSKNLHQNFRISYATTNPDGSGSESASGPKYQDLISLSGSNLSVSAQTLGSITSPQSPPTFPHDGLIGFGSEDGSALRASPWFHSLCNEGALDECRFGLAFGTQGTGMQYFGSVESSEFTGELTSAPITGEWELQGDIVLNGKVIESGADIITDSGTTVIFGPIDSVQSLFDAAGIQSVRSSIGLSFPSSSEQAKEASAASKVFNILEEPLAQTKDGDNCTISIHGSDEFGGAWLVGQAFFQGRYM